MGGTGPITEEVRGRSERGRQRSREGKKAYVGRGCTILLGLLRGGRVPIRFGTYIICNGRNGGLDLALRWMPKANMTWAYFKKKTHQRRLHPRVGRIQHRLHGHAKPALRRGCSFLPDVTTLCGGVHPEVQYQRRRIPAGNGGAAMVHRLMLPCT